MVSHPHAPSGARPRSLLYVEDNPMNLKLVEQLITRRSDLRLLAAVNGLLGFQVMEGLKEIDGDGNLPVLVISAQPNHKARALRAGAKDFVSKPFELVNVAKRVHDLLGIRMLYLETKKAYGLITTGAQAPQQA